jgi:hypothetical protein
MGDEPEFKVIDRRGQRDAAQENTKPSETKPSETKPSETKPTEGQGFVMHEAPKEAPTAPQQVDFATLVLSFATSALIQMGAAPDPATGKVAKDLGLAKQNIDILEILQKKTKGNLSRDEQALLEGVLTEVRLRFVEACR